MDIGFYSTAWNIVKHSFDYKAAIKNWMVYATHISVAVGTSEDNTYDVLSAYVEETGYPITLTRTSFDFGSDPFAYGKTENAALQACKGDILCQVNLDEFIKADYDVLMALCLKLYTEPVAGAYFVPVVNLYGSKEQYLDIGYKWRLHKQGFFRGPVNFGLKDDGRPDYNKTSTDELIDRNANLVPTVNLLPDISIESVRAYVARGMPIAFHAGFLNLSDRLDRSIWWRDFWVKATAGDSNKHATSMEELAARETKLHGLQLWDSV